jgi:hypothetical protein
MEKWFARMLLTRPQFALADSARSHSVHVRLSPEALVGIAGLTAVKVFTD